MDHRVPKETFQVSHQPMLIAGLIDLERLQSKLVLIARQRTVGQRVELSEIG